MRRRTAPCAAIVLALAVSLQLTGCANPAAQTCFDWPHFADPSAAADEADAVALGRVVDQEGTVSYYGVPAATWNVAVDEWISGGGANADIVVTSVPRGCGDTDDSMTHAAGGDPVVLFLHDSDDGWQTVTPRQGIVEPGPGGGVPAGWPPDPNN